MFVNIVQIRDADLWIRSPIASSQMRTDPFFGSLLMRIVAVVQDHHLHIAEDGFDRVVIWTSLGQTDPVQVQFSHHSPSRSRFARMRPVLIQGDPDRLIWIPSADLSHKPADIHRTLSRKVGPSDSPVEGIVDHKQIEPAARLLRPRQDQLLFQRVAASTVGFDKDGFDVKKQQHAVPRKMPENQANSTQNRASLRIIADDFAPDSTQMESPFFNTRRRCSRLMALTTRRFSRYWRSFVADHRP